MIFRILQETYVLEDYIDTILGETDELSKFVPYISLRNNGRSTLTYDFANQYYKWTVDVDASESFIPITSCTGLDDFTIEFDAYLKHQSGFGIGGLVIYEDNSNWYRITNIYNKKSFYYMDNGTGSESEEFASNILAQWVHFKFTITDNTVTKEVYLNDTVVDTVTQTLNSNFFTSNTQYGIPTLWGIKWSNLTYLKNFKIKAL